MLRGFSRFIFQLSNGNVSVFATFMCVAVLIVIARSLAGYEVLIDDMGVQLEAGYRLVAGLGLTHSSFDLWGSLRDITQPVQRKYLTAFPPFLSLYVAGALFFGLSLVTALKLLFSLTTLCGWLGWAAIGSRIMSGPIELKAVAVPAHFIIACLLPFLFTPAWQGTDIILWAGTPFVILLLLHSLENEQRWRYTTTAGLVAGFLYSVRYASAYLAIAALLIIAQFHYRHMKKVLGIYVFFIAGSMVFMVPTAFYGKYANAEARAITENVRLDPERVLDNVKNVMYALNHGLTPHLFWIPESVRLAIFRVNNNPLWQVAFSGLAVVVLCLVPLFILRDTEESKDEKEIARLHLAGALSLTILSLLLFLVLASVLMGYEVVLVPRYYIALGGASLFICYYLCSRNRHQRWASVAKGAGALMIVGFTGYCLALPTLAYLLPDNKMSPLIKEWLPLRVAGARLDRSYPSNDLIRPEDTIKVVQQLSAREPTAIFFITAYYNVLFDNFNPQLRYFWIKEAKKVLNGAYVSRSTKVYFVLGEDEVSDREFANILERSGFRAFMVIPEDETIIFAGQFAAGFSFEAALAN
jgi:hypothetical protein